MDKYDQNSMSTRFYTEPIFSTSRVDKKQSQLKTRQLYRGAYQLFVSYHVKEQEWDFPGGTVVKNPPANAGNMGSSPGPGRSHMPWNS